MPDEHRRSGRDQVGDHRLPAAVAVGGVEEDVAAIGEEQRLHSRLASGDERCEARVGKVGGLARHRARDFVGNARRAGRMEQANAGNAGAGMAQDGSGRQE